MVIGPGTKRAAKEARKTGLVEKEKQLQQAWHTVEQPAVIPDVKNGQAVGSSVLTVASASFRYQTRWRRRAAHCLDAAQNG